MYHVTETISVCTVTTVCTWHTHIVSRAHENFALVVLPRFSHAAEKVEGAISGATSQGADRPPEGVPGNGEINYLILIILFSLLHVEIFNIYVR